MPSVQSQGKYFLLPTYRLLPIPLLHTHAHTHICSHVLVTFDYSQIEMRILAHITEDDYLLQFFREEKDIHRLIASRWLGKDPSEVTDAERDRAKRK